MVGVCGKVYISTKKTLILESHNYKGAKLHPLIIIVLQGVWPKEQSQHLIIQKEITFTYLFYYNCSINK